MLTYRDMPAHGYPCECIESVSFKMDGKGAVITFKAGQQFWIVSSQVWSFQQGAIDVARKGKRTSYPFTHERFARHFKMIG